MYIPAVIQTEAGVFVADLTLQADDRRQQQCHAKLTSLTPFPGHSACSRPGATVAAIAHRWG
jgi:hypothetical protein